MKLIIQSVILSILAHVIYFVGSLIHGIYLTNHFVPDIVNEYADVTYLQNEVAFGHVISPLYYIISFVLISLIGAVVISLFNKFQVSRKSV